MITVDWVINGAGIDGIQYVCGDEFGENIISGVHIMDNPDTYKFFRAGELALTTGYVFKQMKDSEIEEMIETMHEKRCSGIAFKLHRYFDCVPKNIVQKAQENRIPILSIPFEVALSDVQVSLLRKIFEEERLKDKKTENNFIHSLFDKNVNKLELEYLCIANKFSIKELHCVILFEECDYELQKEVIEKEAYARKLSCITCSRNGWLVVICERPSWMEAKEIEAYIKKFVITSNNVMNEKCTQVIKEIGISDFGDYSSITTLFSQATKALMVNSFLKDNQFLSYKEQIMYHFLMDHLTDDALMNVAAPLLRLDDTLLTTLEVLVLNGWKIKETAEILFIHRNTLMFRKDKIFEVLAISEDSTQKSFLEMGVYSYRILKYIRRTI